MIASATALISAADSAQPFSFATNILDLACGPGTLTSELIETCGALPPGSKITALDASPLMIQQVSAKRSERTIAEPQSRWSKVDVLVGDAQDLSPIPDNNYSHILAGLILFLLPQPEKALAECYRVLKSDGVLVLSCWPSSDWQSLMQLSSKVRPDQPNYDIPKAWRNEESVKALVGESGFKDLHTHTVEIHAAYEDAKSVCGWIIGNMPGLQAVIGDFSVQDKQELDRTMVEWLVEKSGTSTGVLTGQCLICVGRK